MDRLPSRRSPDGGPPFFTRASVIAWSAICVATLLAYGAIGETHDAAGVVAALMIAASVVAFMVAWVGGAVLAMRMGSLLALVVAVLFPPFGSVLVALMLPQQPGGGART